MTIVRRENGLQWLSVFTVMAAMSIVMETQAQTYSHTDTLITSLLTGYNTKVRPLTDQSQSLPVQISFQPGAMTEFDFLKGTISFAAVVKLSWIDEKIVWTPASHGNIQKLLIPRTDVWTPPVILTNPATSDLLVGQTWMTVLYNSTGHATFEAGGLLEATCPLDVSKWPFDEQSCSLAFAALGYPATEVTCTAGEVDMIYYVENGEWDITSKSVVSGMLGEYLGVFVNLKLKRRPTFLIVNLLLPIIFLMALSVCVFFLPAESGERVGYCVTILLSIAVFFGVINDYLPSTSQPMANITYYIMVNFVISVLICFGTMISLRLHMKPANAPAPKWCSRYVRVLLCRFRTNQVDADVKDEEGKDTYPATKQLKHMKMADYDPNAEPVRRCTGEEVTWKQLGDAVDRIQCILFSLFIVVFTAWFMISLAT